MTRTNNAMPRTVVTYRSKVRTFGQCNSYDGATSKTTLATNPTTATNNFSIFAWIKPNGLPQNSTCIFENGNDANGYGLFVGNAGGSSGSLLCALNSAISWIGGGGNAFTLTDNVWQHVGLVRRNGAMYFYLNGVEKSAGYVVTPGTPTSGKATIGYQLSSTNVAQRFFNGLIDHVRVWNTALTARQAYEHYINGTVFSPSNLKLEQLGTSGVDTSGQGNTATSVATSAVTSNTSANKTRSQTAVLGLQFDGSQNHLSLGSMGNFGSNLGSGFYAAFTIKTTATTSQCVIGGGNTGSTTCVLVYINAIAGGTVSAKKIRVFFRADDNKRIDCGMTNTYNFNDGIPHNVVITANGSTNTVTITIDGVSQAITYGTQTTPTTFSNFTNTLAVGTRDNAGSYGGYFSGLIKNLSIGTSAGALYGVYALNGNALDTSGNNNHGALVGNPSPYYLSRTTVT